MASEMKTGRSTWMSSYLHSGLCFYKQPLQDRKSLRHMVELQYFPLCNTLLQGNVHNHKQIVQEIQGPCWTIEFQLDRALDTLCLPGSNAPQDKNHLFAQESSFACNCSKLPDRHSWTQHYICSRNSNSLLLHHSYTRDQQDTPGIVQCLTNFLCLHKIHQDKAVGLNLHRKSVLLDKKEYNSNIHPLHDFVHRLFLTDKEHTGFPLRKVDRRHSLGHYYH
mmetsp:Transcript_34625/g.78131  ORF Transcript_34625/g.78131 Transcript_34625/m.78131 type:complete len:221 (-) Transcript_34625:178-840(-)